MKANGLNEVFFATILLGLNGYFIGTANGNEEEDFTVEEFPEDLMPPPIRDDFSIRDEMSQNNLIQDKDMPKFGEPLLNITIPVGREALLSCVVDNLQTYKSEQWLKEQAQAMGWAKATKLEGRETAQGLVGVILNKNIGALVEVNCETDFVARNEKFQEFVDLASRACLKYVTELPESELISRTEFQTESLKNLLSGNNKKLSDELALLIGSVGENAQLKRALGFKVPQSIQLIGMSYPSPKNAVVADGEVQTGTIGTILGIRSSTEISEELKKNLCLQVIGSNPLKVGNKEQDKPTKDIDDETCLIYQEYVFDTSINVGELLDEKQIEIVDFQRYKCGENVDSEENLSAATAKN